MTYFQGRTVSFRECICQQIVHSIGYLREASCVSMSCFTATPTGWCLVFVFANAEGVDFHSLQTCLEIFEKKRDSFPTQTFSRKPSSPVHFNESHDFKLGGIFLALEILTITTRDELVSRTVGRHDLDENPKAARMIFRSVESL